ncbi:MAG: FHA domain-containing protein [Pseudomonadota bacterium]
MAVSQNPPADQVLVPGSPAASVLAQQALDDDWTTPDAATQVVLRPVSRSVTGPILLDDELLVGRDSAPFSELDRAVVAMLSRRHARVYLHAGRPYVEDLGSLNGCYVDGQKIGSDPRELEAGDELDFGGELRFSVEVIDQAPADQTMLVPQGAVELSLVPVGNDSLDGVVINRFPFILSRNCDSFARLKAADPTAIKMLSRRHALISCDGHRLFIEDLDSANGTYLGGRRVQRQPLELSDGDRLLFGDKRFGYEVRINVLDEERTIFITADGDRRRGEAAVVPVPAETCTLDLEQLKRQGHLAASGVQIVHEFRAIKRRLLDSIAASGSDTEAIKQSMLLITSSLAGEGKSWVALNLAMSMASEHDYRVLLVDAHATGSGLSEQLGLNHRQGLVDGLRDATVPLDGSVLGTNVPGLSVLPLGRISEGLDELYASEATARQFNELARRDPHEIVIIDGPQLCSGTQAQTLARQAGQTIVVVEANKTPREALKANVATLAEREGVALLLNKKQ